MLHPKVLAKANGDQNLASKITGLLVDLEVLDVSEVIDIIENPADLDERFGDAMDTLKNVTT